MNDLSLLPAVVASLVTLGGLLVLYRTLTGQMERREIAPQPLVVKPETAFMTEAACGQHQRELEQRISAVETARKEDASALKSDVGELQKTTSVGLDGLHTRVTRLLEAFGEFKGDLGVIKGRLGIHDKN